MSTDREAAVVLQHVVQTIAPGARVETADTAILRDPPDADCVIIAVGAMHSEAESLARDLRGRGYRNGLLVVADSPESFPREELALLGIGGALPTGELATALPPALADQRELQEAAMRSPVAAQLLDSLRQLQALVAVGQAAGGLKHRLNNPLAALLAEAQMMELEPLSPDHASALKRIVELCRRVISVADTIDTQGTQRAG
jgi:signal transduction histidine kinase